MLRLQRSPLAGSSSTTSSASPQLRSRPAHSLTPVQVPRHLRQPPGLRVLASASSGLRKPMSSGSNAANGASTNGASSSSGAQNHHASSVVDFLELIHNLKVLPCLVPSPSGCLVSPRLDTRHTGDRRCVSGLFP